VKKGVRLLLLPADARIEAALYGIEVFHGQIEAAETAEEGLLRVDAVLDRLDEVVRKLSQACRQVIRESVEGVAIRALQHDREVVHIVELGGNGPRGHHAWRGVGEEFLESRA